LRRQPNPFTGFDPADDFLLSSLSPSPPGPDGNDDRVHGNRPARRDAAGNVRKAGYYGPYPIVNAALNLNSGSELAQQERKASSFVFTPRFCGFAPSRSEGESYSILRRDFDQDGYHETLGYSHPNGPHLGTAMAISGAAASPNMGYHTSGPMAFLLTVFDARLGWWLGNPRNRAASGLPGPLFAIKYLFAELAGLTTSRSPFVNLSDGGHFENLGLYELVRRRCRYIIVGDAEQDGDLTFESLGGAIRKCRADFGVEIDIDPDPIRLNGRGFSDAHCVVGSITYPEIEAGRAEPFCEGPERMATDRARGWILYLKASLTGDEPADVIEYRSRNRAFPHQSTSNQFFTESQFESYRRLGLHIVRDAFEDVNLARVKMGAEEELIETFQSLAQKWYAPVPVKDETASRLANGYADLMRRLGTDPALASLFAVLTPGEQPASQEQQTGLEARPALTPVLGPAGQMFLLEVVQLMQNVFTEFHLEHAENRANPRNAGWMRLFVHWSSSPALKTEWTKVKREYNPLFRAFMDDHLSESTDVPPPK
jgi:hypothetical protein